MTNEKVKRAVGYLAAFAMAIMTVAAVKTADVQAATTFEDAKVFELNEMTEKHLRQMIVSGFMPMRQWQLRF